MQEFSKREFFCCIAGPIGGGIIIWGGYQLLSFWSFFITLPIAVYWGFIVNAWKDL